MRNNVRTNLTMGGLQLETPKVRKCGGYAGEHAIAITGDFNTPSTLRDGATLDLQMFRRRNGKNLRGSLLMIRHLPDGTKYRIKSNALGGLALGEDPTVPMGWAFEFMGPAINSQMLSVISTAREL